MADKQEKTTTRWPFVHELRCRLLLTAILLTDSKIHIWWGREKNVCIIFCYCIRSWGDFFSKVDIRDDKITIYKRKRLLFIVSNCMQDKKVIPIIYVDANVTLIEDALYSLWKKSFYLISYTVMKDQGFIGLIKILLHFVCGIRLRNDINRVKF